MKKGVLAGAGAYILWGVLPVYWKAVERIPSLELLGQRVIWSFLVVILLLILRRNWDWLSRARQKPRLLLPLVATAILLGGNWFTYIWAATNGHIVEASLGYFITPLANILLGLVFLRERLRPGQWIAVAIAVAGAVYLTLNIGGLLWISFSLAFTFGLYGLLRKTAALDSLEGLSVEMIVLFLPALLYLINLQAGGRATIGQAGLGIQLLIAAAGVITAIPLLFFAYGAQRIPLTTLGVLQYIAPSLQFLLGVFIFHEAFSLTRLFGFSIIWVALLVYTVESYLYLKHSRAALAIA